MIFCSKPSKSVQFRWFFQNFIKHFVDFANLKIFKKTGRRNYIWNDGRWGGRHARARVGENYTTRWNCCPKSICLVKFRQNSTWKFSSLEINNFQNFVLGFHAILKSFWIRVWSCRRWWPLWATRSSMCANSLKVSWWFRKNILRMMGDILTEFSIGVLIATLQAKRSTLTVLVHAKCWDFI